MITLFGLFAEVERDLLRGAAVAIPEDLMEAEAAP